jgi:hypothetical protein
VFPENFFSYLGKIGVSPENFFGDGGGGRRSGAKGGQKWPIDGGPQAGALRH